MARTTAVTPKKKAVTVSGSSVLQHPPYFQMISEAISTMKERTGSSQPAITKFVEDRYKAMLPPNFKKVLSIQLKKFVKSERVVKVKNSFKMPSTQKLKSATKAKSSFKEKASKIIVKTKRVSQVKTPEVLKEKKEVKIEKMKMLSQIRTPDGFKKTKNVTPWKSKSSNAGGNSRKQVNKAKK
ncbi:hypothetical protein K2173_025458 [Erythroxylum novogranatense]|uniref:H15 domain-containing protein n=1 Tax=Erythroxylum novogranatense TaxID=1862640 RepID=A0AAV8SBI9_9ROSI|nr:hypothetical protein K2173_025458 [Erythroxylum novogranatense]